MKATKENFITARYLDNDKRTVEVLYTENGETVSHVMQHDNSHPDFKKLLEITTINDLHSNTVAFIKSSQKDFREHISRIASVELKQVKAGLNTPFYKELTNFLFEYDDDKKEELFNLKLFVFEKEEVKNSQDTESKAAMRKAQTPLDFFSAFSKLK